VYGSPGLLVIRFKFATMPNMEELLQYAKGIGLHFPLA